MKSRKLPRGSDLRHPETGVVLAQTWIRTYAPNAIPLERYPIGQVNIHLPPDSLDESSLRAFSGHRPHVQYLVILEREMLLVEGVVQATAEKIYRLAELKARAPSTPELRDYKDLPVRAILCAQRGSPEVLTLARRMEVEVHIPKWIWEQPDPSPTYSIDQPLGNIENGASASDKAARSASDTADPDGMSASSGG